jgi:hypothetical protein
VTRSAISSRYIAQVLGLKEGEHLAESSRPPRRATAWLSQTGIWTTLFAPRETSRFGVDLMYQI